MSRLYYEPTPELSKPAPVPPPRQVPTAPPGEQAPAPQREPAAVPGETAAVPTTAPGEPASSPQTLQFLEKVAKLVPSEVIAGYIALVGFIAAVSNEDARVWLYWAAFALCVVLTPVYLNTQAQPARPKRNHLIVSTVAFVVWAYAVSGAVLVPGWYEAAIASIVLVAFSLVSGVIPLDR